MHIKYIFNNILKNSFYLIKGFSLYFAIGVKMNKENKKEISKNLNIIFF